MSIIIGTTEIMEYMEHLGRESPEYVISRLNRGDRVRKSIFFDYVIDDPEIYTRLGNVVEGKLPWALIYNKLKSGSEAKSRIAGLLRDRSTMVNNKLVLPFSVVFNEGLGECAEKSIVAQLYAQTMRKSYYVEGGLRTGGNDFSDLHSFNIIFTKGGPILFDGENPKLTERDNGPEIEGFLAPIVGIEPKTGEVRLPDEWNLNGTYIIDLLTKYNKKTI